MPGDKGFAIHHPVAKQIMMHRTKSLLRLPQTQLMVHILLYLFSVKVYQQLLCSLTKIARLVFCWLTLQITGFCILLYFGLKISRALCLILTEKIQRAVLAPAVEILWHFQTTIRHICFGLARALPYCLTRWTSGLFLLFCSSVEHQFHHLMYNFCQEKLETYKAMLQQAMKQIVVSLFLGFLAGLQEAFCITVQVLKYVLTQFFHNVRPTWRSACKAAILDDITCSLPNSCTPLRSHFKGPPIHIFEDIPQTFADLKFVVATEHIVSGPGRYGLDATDIPLYVRFQNNIRIKNASSVPETEVTLKWVKAAFMFYIALYVSVLSGAVKNIK